MKKLLPLFLFALNCYSSTITWNLSPSGDQVVNGNLTVSGTISGQSVDSIYQWAMTNNQTFGYAPSNTIMLLGGQSLMTGLAWDTGGGGPTSGAGFTNWPFIKQFKNVIVTAVGATTLGDEVNRWNGTNWNNTTNSQYSLWLTNGTKGIYVFWGDQGAINTDPTVEIATMTNFVNQLISSNFMVVWFTTEPIGTDLRQQTYFMNTWNNYIRRYGQLWRVVDWEQMAPNLTDFSIYWTNSFDHMYNIGYTNAGLALIRELQAPSRTMNPMVYAGAYNDSYVIMPPSTNSLNYWGFGGYLKGGWYRFSFTGSEFATNSWPPPPHATQPGAFTIVNSNGTSIYIIKSGLNSTTWTSTNLWF